MKLIEKLQNLPELYKKIVLWTIVAILGLAMGFFWFKSTIDKFSKIELPKIDIPQNNEYAR